MLRLETKDSRDRVAPEPARCLVRVHSPPSDQTYAELVQDLDLFELQLEEMAKKKSEQEELARVCHALNALFLNSDLF